MLGLDMFDELAECRAAQVVALQPQQALVCARGVQPLHDLVDGCIRFRLAVLRRCSCIIALRRCYCTHQDHDSNDNGCCQHCARYNVGKAATALWSRSPFHSNACTHQRPLIWQQMARDTWPDSSRKEFTRNWPRVLLL